MKPFTARNPVPMAIVGLTLIAGSIGLAVNVGRLPFIGDGPGYSAVFADASGLQPKEEVRIAGIKVGSVSSITLDGAAVLVRFHVKDVTFGTQTTASIQIKTLLGQHYVALDPEGPGRMSPGSQIPLSRTAVPLNIVPAFQTLTSRVNSINTAQVTKALNSLSSALDASAPQLKGALNGLTRVSQTIASRSGQIQDLLARARTVSSTVAAEGGAISQLITASNAVLAVLAERNATIHEVLTGATALAEQLHALVQDNKAQLGPALTKLGQVVHVLTADNSQLDTILRELPAYLRLFTNVVGSGEWFDATIKVPDDLALCTSLTDTGLTRLLAPILSHLNMTTTGSSKPCLPLAPTGGGK